MNKKHICDAKSLFGRKQRLSPWWLGDYFIELSELLGAGLALGEALHTLSEGIDERKFCGWLKVRNDVDNGKALPDALREHFPRLPGFCVEMIREGENSGNLIGILESLGGYMQEMEDLSSGSPKVRRLFYYPLTVLMVLVLVTATLTIFVIPQFEELFSGFGAELPSLTAAVISLSRALNQWWWLLFGLLGLLIWLYRYLASHWDPFRRFLATILPRIPLYGKIFSLVVVTEFTRTIGFCTSMGKDLGWSLGAARDALDSNFARKAVERMAKNVADGAIFAEAIEAQPLFPNRLAHAARIGEQTGKLDRQMRRLANNYAANLNRRIAAGGQVIEPILMVLVGGIVGTLVIAMYLPIFKMAAVV